LAGWLSRATAQLAEEHRSKFLVAGADDAVIATGDGDGRTFGGRLRDLARELAGFDGLIVLGSGAMPLATVADRRRFVEAARRPREALANNRFSADVVAFGGLGPLVRLPDLRTDNALPRWLAEVHGYRVLDLKGRWRLGVDLDSPLDILLTRLDRGRDAITTPPEVDLGAVRQRLAAVARVSRDPGAELLVAGRVSTGGLGWLERSTACRVRAVVEERGLRAGADGPWPARLGSVGGQDSEAIGSSAGSRPPASVLGAVVERDGPDHLGEILGRLADAAVVDTRVLLAHRLGRDEGSWPAPEDRFASDLLLPDRIADPWLRQLTAAALAAPIPILLGGHSLVGPGLRLALAATSHGKRRT
jgi:hypothetical protein